MSHPFYKAATWLGLPPTLSKFVTSAKGQPCTKSTFTPGKILRIFKPHKQPLPRQDHMELEASRTEKNSRVRARLPALEKLQTFRLSPRRSAPCKKPDAAASRDAGLHQVD
ncbi:hypothetical protein K402DRAFT_462872 [Aulographum hederae CBS 113979]|uniref:Uncharacterized protein n=1 Tax=Aulographum hederae CBS 113979 TaxID=1176131 RepID=A0A6G1H2B8_9PEZI|nr:hypothetical protein K402DRAFT_462872 [Aulographum hederae CBS 113979]